MSNLVVAAHQPNFMPNLSYFQKMLKADTFILITNLQFEKHEGWQQRNKISMNNNDLWLTVPVLGSQNQLLKDVKIDKSGNWNKKHKKTLQLNYAKTEEKEFLKKLEEIYDLNPDRLVDMSIPIILLIKEYLGIPTKVIVDEDISGEKHNLLINICKKYNASKYLSGKGALQYMDDAYLSELENNNVEHEIIESHLASEYPYSALYYILKEGKDKVNEILGNAKLSKQSTPVLYN